MQEDKTADEHIQDFKKAALKASYEGLWNLNCYYILHSENVYQRFNPNQ